MVTLSIILGVLSLIFAAVFIVLAVRISQDKKALRQKEQDRILAEQEKCKLQEQLTNLQSTYNEQLTHYVEQLGEVQAKNTDLQIQLQAIDSNNDTIEAYTIAKAQLDDVMNAYNALMVEYSTTRNDLDQLNENYISLTDTYNKLNVANEVLTSAYTKILNSCNSISQLHHDALVRSFDGYRGRAAKMDFTARERLELGQLKEVLGLLSNPAPLNKAIYEMYYRDKIKTLLAEKGLDTRKSGIYRLWQNIDGIEYSYVGQSVDIGER